MARGRREHKTFHISVPLEDDQVLEWLSKQYNQSASMRELIRAAIGEIGMVDLFTGRPYNRKPGQAGRAKLPPVSTNTSTLTARKRKQKAYVDERQAAVDEMEKADAKVDKKEDVIDVVPTTSVQQSFSPRTSSGSGIRMDESVLADLVEEEQPSAKPLGIDVDDIQAMLDE